MRSRVQSMSSTLTSSSWPICTISDGCEMRPHDMSVMWSRPSTPPRSMNAPKSVMFLTTPFRTWSFWSSFISFSRLPARSVSRITRRDTTMLRRRLLSLMILNSNFWPSSSSMLGTRRRAICEPGQERVHAHQVDHHAALDLLDQRAFDRLVRLVGHADAFPHAHEVGLLLRQDDRAFLVLEVLEQDLDLVARLEVGEVLELLERDAALGLEADVEHDEVVADLEHRALDDLAFLDRREGPVVHVQHPLVVGGGVFVFLVQFRTAVGERAQLRLLGVALFPQGGGAAGRGGIELGHKNWKISRIRG